MSRSSVALIAAAAFLVGCAGGIGSPGYAPQNPARGGVPRNGISGTLYVQNNGPNNEVWLSIYRPPDFQLSQKILGQTDGGNQGGSGNQFDNADNYYWLDWVHGTVAVIPPGAKAPSYTITQGLNGPWAPALAASGTLYVSNFSAYQNQYGVGFVTVFPPGKALPSYAIYNGMLGQPSALALDSNGNLFVANIGTGYYGPPRYGRVNVYAPGAKSPSRIITNGIMGPDALAIDSSDTLYVANEGPYGRFSPKGTVTVYAPGATSPSYTITQGVSAPVWLAIDREQNLYVANRTSNSVSVYTPGQPTPKYVINIGGQGRGPNAIALDGADDLFVCNGYGGSFNGSVSIYKAGSPQPFKTITRGLYHPVVIGIAP